MKQIRFNGNYIPGMEYSSESLQEDVERQKKRLKRHINSAYKRLLWAVKLERDLGFPVSAPYETIHVIKSIQSSDNYDREFLLILEPVCDSLGIDIAERSITKKKDFIECWIFGPVDVLVKLVVADGDVCIPVTETITVTHTTYVCNS
jgi:hypothetical protein